MRHITRSEFKQLTQQMTLEALEKHVRPLLSAQRLAKIEQVLASRLQSVAIAVENPYDPHNAAAIVRSAEALGVLNVFIVGQQATALNAPSTTQGAYHWVNTQGFVEHDNFFSYIKAQGYMLWGAVPPKPNLSFYSLDEVPTDQPVCLFFGNEHRGLSEQALQACTGLFTIDLYGVSESLNLSVSAAISLYDVCRRVRQNLMEAGNCDSATQAYERVYAMARSVDKRFLQGT